MERKIMSLGRSSKVISLPKNWMELNELKKGDIVSLAIQRDRALVVYPGTEKKATPKEITIRIGQNDDEILIAQKIMGSYLSGYSGITLIAEKFFAVPQRTVIRNISRILYMRVMESDSKTMYIQSLMDESRVSLEQAIQRMHLISHSMCEDTLNALKNRDVTLAKSASSLDEDVGHFSLFIVRVLRNAAENAVLANELRVDPLDGMDKQTLVYMMEHIADYSADIANQIVMLDENQQKIPDSILELMFIAGTEAVDLYIKAVNAFFSKDVLSSVEILRKQQAISQLDQEITSKAITSRQKNVKLIYAIYSICDDIKRIAECAADIAKTAINRSFKET